MHFLLNALLATGSQREKKACNKSISKNSKAPPWPVCALQSHPPASQGGWNKCGWNKCWKHFPCTVPAEMQHLWQNYTWPNPNFAAAGPDLHRSNMNGWICGHCWLCEDEANISAPAHDLWTKHCCSPPEQNKRWKAGIYKGERKKKPKTNKTKPKKPHPKPYKQKNPKTQHTRTPNKQKTQKQNNQKMKERSLFPTFMYWETNL